MYDYITTLDISINKPFKNFLKEKYIRYCIEKKLAFSKVGKNDIIIGLEIFGMMIILFLRS